MCVLAAVAATAVLPVSGAAASVLPAGFTDELVTTMTLPISLNFTPDGRMVMASKTGRVRVYQNGAMVPTPALDLSSQICTDVERGLESVAIDPDFADNHFVYLYYTYKKFGGCDIDTSLSPVNRAVRYVLGDDDLIDPASAVVLVDGIPSRSGNHNAGDMAFGKDGYLYISTGDGGCDFRGNSGCFPLNDASQDLGGLSGKILRITSSGGIPTGNPFTGPNSDRCNVQGFTTVTRKCREVYAWGLRNPFRFDFDPNAAQTRFFINDVGLSTWEEIDEGGPGLNYGWNVREGPCARNSTTDCGPPPPGMTNPIYAFDHSSGCTSVTMSEFVPGNVWPDSYVGAYIWGDSTCSKMFALRRNGTGYSASDFGSDMGPIIDGTFGPSGDTEALYYISWVNWPNHEIRRITFTGSTNRAPTAHVSASPTNGELPLEVEFDGSHSSDPDEDTLTYQWDFGDGSPADMGAQVPHEYPTAGTYTATLTVTDGNGGEDTETIRIDAGNRAPNIAIISPDSTYQFGVGDQITLTGTATDPDEGPLPDSALSWRVERHHNTHTHPYLPPTQGNNVSVTGPPAEDLSSATNSYLDVYLTATDSQGLSSTVLLEVQPHKVDLTFETDPTGLQVELVGERITGPRTVTSWEGWQLPVKGFAQHNPSGGWYGFASWSDGGAAEHTIVTPAEPATYSGSYVPIQLAQPASATPVRMPLVPAYPLCQSPNTTHVSPLALPSCHAAGLESSLLTLGTEGLGSGLVKLSVLNGDMSTTDDEEDVRIVAQATDVLRAIDGADYTGNTLLRLGMRITDMASGSYGDEPASVIDAVFSAPVSCAATPRPRLGARCSLTTTADTLAPNFAREGKRAMLNLRSLGLDDAGADGQISPSGGGCPPTCGTGDEHSFLREGIFTP